MYHLEIWEGRGQNQTDSQHCLTHTYRPVSSFGPYASSLTWAYGTVCDQTRNRSQRCFVITNQAENSLNQRACVRATKSHRQAYSLSLKLAECSVAIRFDCC